MGSVVELRRISVSVFALVLVLNSRAWSSPCVDFVIEVFKSKTAASKRVRTPDTGSETDSQRWSLQNLPSNFEGEYRVYRKLAVNFFTGEVSFGEESLDSPQSIPAEYQIAVVEMIKGKPRRARWLTDNSDFLLAG